MAWVLKPVDTTKSPHDSAQGAVMQVTSLGLVVTRVQLVSPIITLVIFMCSLNPPPAMVIVCPPWMEPDAGLMVEITILDLSFPRLLTALPTPPFLCNPVNFHVINDN